MGKLLCHLHYVVQEIQCVVSVSGRWRGCLEPLKQMISYRPLGFGSKTLPSSASADWNSFRRTWGFRILSSSLQVFHAKSENPMFSLSESWF